jgi:hypothetical protein
MKSATVVAFVILAAVFVLSGCEGFTLPGFPTPTPPPPPHAENATWQITITGIEADHGPAELVCSDCGKDVQNAPIYLQQGYMYVKVTALVTNLSAAAREVPVFAIGLRPELGVMDCGGVTYNGDDYCLLAGAIRGDKTYVNHDVEPESFRQAITFAPNAPESVQFLFILRDKVKPVEFYFDDLSVLDVHKVKMSKGQNLGS